MPAAGEGQILRPGENCWRIERAGKLALVIDAADYFVAVKDAVLQARHSVYLIGWDFDTRINFEPEGKTLEGPNRLGTFLRWIDKNRPGLQVYMLKWNLGFMFDIMRGALPLFILDRLTSSRIHLSLDSAHPPGAAHHQKIAVIDDVLAFCGGIDMTADRWDTRQHLDDDERRKRPSGRRYGPWHDASIIVDGDAARALGDLARQRWNRATGEWLEAPPQLPPIWPKNAEPVLEDVAAGIARTQPEYDGVDEVREVEAFYLDAIASARDSIYCESQYFASQAIADAIARRLREDDPPEIVVLNPRSADGWLEAKAMDGARARLLEMIGRNDRHDRFRIFTPVTKRGNPIYVHAKVMIVDDRLLRVGSSNFNNRSLGFDTECDLIVEAVPGEARAAKIRSAITEIRNDLLAEHLGCAVGEVRDALKREKSLIGAIERLCGKGKTLVPYEPDEPGPVEDFIAENGVFDPERPHSAKRLVMRALSLGRLCLR